MGVSGLVGGGGVGNFVESGGFIGPLDCARNAAGTAARSMKRAPSISSLFDLIRMEAMFTRKMQFPGNMLPDLNQCIAIVSSRTGFSLSSFEFCRHKRKSNLDRLKPVLLCERSNLISKSAQFPFREWCTFATIARL